MRNREPCSCFYIAKAAAPARKTNESISEKRIGWLEFDEFSMRRYTDRLALPITCHSPHARHLDQRLLVYAKSRCATALQVVHRNGLVDGSFGACWS
jgi:hypothetical protein